MNLDKESSKKIYYSMGEVAEMFGVNQSLIRHWEKNFDILKPHKNKKGNRLFSEKDIHNLRAIYHLVKERGMTLQGAAKYMKNGTDEISRDAELAERLQGIRIFIKEIIDEIDCMEKSDSTKNKNTVLIEFKDEITEADTLTSEKEPDLFSLFGNNEI